MQDTQRWFHIGLGVLNAVVMSGLIYLVVSGLVDERPWWLAASAALALPEIIRGALAEFGGRQKSGPASHRTVRLATKTLCAAGMLLLILGIASV